MVDVRSLDEVVDVVERTAGEKVIISDVDNTLVPQGVPVDEFKTAVNAAIDRLEANPRVARVIALTNGRERRVPRIVSHGNKPWTSRRRLRLRGARSPIVVVGDQVLTDGLLAWRLQSPYLQLVVDCRHEPPRQAFMRRIGRVVSPVLFHRMAAGDLTSSDGLTPSGELS